MARKFSSGYLWRSLISIALGLLLIIWPDFAASYMVIIIGAMLLTLGVIMMTAYYAGTTPETRPAPGFPVGGVGCLVAGILLIAMHGAFVSILVVLMGILLVLAAADQIYMLVRASRDGVRVHPAHYVVPVLILLTGIVVALNPWDSVKLIIIIFGCAVLVYGIVDLVDRYVASR